ncbi:MAG: DUF805 domain-containing protein [Hyphomonadaceae bacterium]
MKWIKFYLSPYGRVPLDEFYLEFVLPLAIVFFGIKWAVVQMAGPEPDYLPLLAQFSSLVAVAILAWPMMCVTTKRLHDSGLTGWWQFLFAIPVWIAPPFGMLWIYIFWTFEGGGLIYLFWLAIGCVAIIAGVATIGLHAGTLGSNRYGEDPRPGEPSKPAASV